MELLTTTVHLKPNTRNTMERLSLVIALLLTFLITPAISYSQSNYKMYICRKTFVKLGYDAQLIFHPENKDMRVLILKPVTTASEINYVFSAQRQGDILNHISIKYLNGIEVILRLTQKDWVTINTNDGSHVPSTPQSKAIIFKVQKIYQKMLLPNCSNLEKIKNQSFLEAMMGNFKSFF